MFRMKKKLSFLAIVILAGTTFIACKNTGKTKSEAASATVSSTESSVAANANYSVAASASVLNWKANQIGGGHHGTFNVESGSIALKENGSIAGSFVIAIKSLKVIDVIEAEDNTDLVGHLLNPDFFDSDKFPKAYFTITAMEGAVLKGNLKMKGIEEAISFPIKIAVHDATLKITSEVFTIDRTLWGITKSSGKFFDPVKLGDRLIKDEVEMSIEIVGKK